LGPTCQLGVERGEGSSMRGPFPMMEAETGQGIGGAHGATGPGKEGDSLGKSGPVRRLGLARLKSEEKIFSEQKLDF
jgi:hypothetical protein